MIDGFYPQDRAVKKQNAPDGKRSFTVGAYAGFVVIDYYSDAAGPQSLIVHADAVGSIAQMIWRFGPGPAHRLPAHHGC